MLYAFRFLKPVYDKEFIKMMDKNNNKSSEYRDEMFKKIQKVVKQKEMSSFEHYCRYGKA